MQDKTNKSQVSQKKLEANRTNAQRSTGPKTQAGKAKAAQNSYKHGVFALRLFSSAEQRVKDGPDYNALYRGFYQHYSPEGYMENFWLEKITTEALRLARLLGFEQEAFGRMSAFLDRTLDKLMRYETAVTKHFTQAMMHLENLQRERKAEFAQMEAAELETGSTDSEDSVQVNSSNTSEPNPPASAAERRLLRESVETGAIERRPTESYGTNPSKSHELAQFTDEASNTSASELQEMTDDQSERLKDTSTEMPAQASTSLNTSGKNPPLGPTEAEIYEAIFPVDDDRRPTNNCGTKPTQSRASVQFTDVEPPTDG